MEPALDDRDKASARPKPASPTSINRVPRVLVVEDEQDIAGLRGACADARRERDGGDVPATRPAHVKRAANADR